MATDQHEGPDPSYVAFFVARPDGSELREIARFGFHGGFDSHNNLAWAPDSRHVGLCVEADARARRECYLVDALGEAERQRIPTFPGIPDSWFADYWPQWHGQQWPQVLPAE